jgi:hypothetical protein
MHDYHHFVIYASIRGLLHHRYLAFVSLLLDHLVQVDPQRVHHHFLRTTFLGLKIRKPHVWWECVLSKSRAFYVAYWSTTGFNKVRFTLLPDTDIRWTHNNFGALVHWRVYWNSEYFYSFKFVCYLCCDFLRVKDRMLFFGIKII